MEAISQEANLPFEKLTNVIHGGTHKGTWLHSDLYIVFARWLNPTFAVKCDKKIREILEGNSLPQEQNILPVLVEMAKVNQMLVQSNQEIVANLTNMNVGLHEMLATMHYIKHDTSRIKEDMNAQKEQLKEIRVAQKSLTPLDISLFKTAIDEKVKELSKDNPERVQAITRSIYSYINGCFNVSSYYFMNWEQIWESIQIIKNLKIEVLNA